MTLSELLTRVPELENYIRYMPDELRDRCTVRTYPPGTIIHQKDAELDYFGIVCEGYHRVINEFENGNVFMIERNDPIDFVGEVAILAGKPRTSVTLETTTECTVLYFSRKDFEDWISKDIHFLRLVSQKVAYKLYRSSYNRGSRLFYPPRHLREDAEPDYPKTEGGGACGNHQGEGVHDQGAAGEGKGISEERVTAIVFCHSSSGPFPFIAYFVPLPAPFLTIISCLII